MKILGVLLLVVAVLSLCFGGDWGTVGILGAIAAGCFMTPGSELAARGVKGWGSGA